MRRLDGSQVSQSVNDGFSHYMDRLRRQNDEQLGAPAGVGNITVSRRVSRSSDPMASTDVPS
eukprot:4446240-Pyramimonas_sp.AAC.1